ncbi:MAG: Ig-like domain-containing protein [Gemmatimonadaceae bacterium]
MTTDPTTRRPLTTRARSALRRRARRAITFGGTTAVLASLAMFAGCGGGGDGAVAPITAAISISPANPVVELAETVRLVANVDGAPAEASTVHWSTADAGIATVDGSGLVTGRAVGTVRVAASARGRSAETTVRVTPPGVARVNVVAGATSLAVGDTTPLTVTAYGADDRQLTGRTVTVTSETPTTVAVVTGPRAVAMAPGSARIVATVEGVSASTTITVSAASVATVELIPDSLTVAVGRTARLVAVAHDRGGAVLTGRPVTFSSDQPTVARVAGDGTVTALAAGRARITATVEGVTATAVVIVPAAAAAQLSVTPASATLMIADTVRLQAVLRDADGQVLTGRTISWSSTNTDVAEVSSSGVVTARGLGVAVIVAASQGLTASAGVTVVRTPVKTLTVSPTSLSLTVGETGQLTATPRDVRGTVVPDVPISWTSSAPNVATVSSTGEVRALAAGSATVTATAAGKSAAVEVAVRRAPVATIAISPGTLALRVGATSRLTVTARNADGATIADATISWRSSATTVATVSSSGEVRALSVGSTTITATSEGRSANVSVTVSPPMVDELTVDPSSLTLTVGEERTLTATARDADGDALESATIAWTSSAPAVATVSSTGRVTAVAVGSAAITATSEGKAASVAVTVTRPPVATVTIAPSTLVLEAGATGQLTATARDASGAAVSDAAFTWRSSDEGVVHVSPSGEVRGLAPGVITATATSGDATGSATVTVQAAAVPPPDDPPDESPGPGPAARIIIVSGDDQEGERRETLPEKLVVQVLDANDVPVPDVPVLWLAADGGITTPDDILTGADGTSSARWRLGGGRGSQTATASVSGVGTVTFHANSDTQ